MKKSNENKNFQINRVEDRSKTDNSVEFTDNSQKRPPQPLTREQLEYYHKAREQALKRKSKPISGKESNRNTRSNEAYKRPIKNYDGDKELFNKEGSKHTGESINLSKNNNFEEIRNASNNPDKNIKQDKAGEKREQAAKRAEHLRKQAYYDSKYADETEIVEYYDYSGQERIPKKSRNFVHVLFRFISWLIFFIVFIVIGYFLAKLILS